MTSKLTARSMLALLCLVAATASYGQDGRRYDDRVYSDRRPTASDCDIIARRASRDAGGLGDGRVARGTVRGAIVGGLLGGSDGAKRGAALGLIAGGARRAESRSSAYDRVFDDCMRGYLPY